MNAMPAGQPQKSVLTPVDLPRLRAVSTRSPIDVPVLTSSRPEPVALRAVPDLTPAEAMHAPRGLERLVGALKVGIIISASVAFALGLELWLTF